jgi:(R,R)-butanediol dehydrogenase/meso-butanediol dehydrogenase/diacetyl reductase
VCLAPDQLAPGTPLMREATLRWVMYYTRAEFEMAARLIATADVDAASFVTGRIALDDIDDAFRDLTGGATTHRKVLVVP